MDKKDSPKNWRNILWREWRYTDDEEYAKQLFDILAYKLSFNWRAAFYMMVWGMVWGAIVGLLMILLSIFLAPIFQSIFGEISSVKIIAGTWVIGGAPGILMTPLLNKRFKWAGLFLRLGIGTVIGLTALFIGGSIPVAIILGILASIFGIIFATRSTNNETAKTSAKILLNYINQKTTLLEYLLPYKRRHWYFWWRGRPTLAEVEISLRHARKERPQLGMTWSQSLRRLEYPHEYPASLDQFLAGLGGKRWSDRFIARHRLFDYGGEAVKPVLSTINRRIDLQPTGMHILKNIAWETSAKLSTQASNLVCPNCLTRCHAHKIDLTWQPDLTFYGCRNCQQSRDFLECPQGIVAVLDAGWPEMHRLQNGLLRVNWLAQQHLFDFDRVEIVQATDEEVERFAMQVGNDTDPVRQSRYAQMPCLIVPDCRLSENSLRILRNFFGRVERQKIVQPLNPTVEDSEEIITRNIDDEQRDAHFSQTG